jgi:P pilus assembly chaperone PapD
MQGTRGLWQRLAILVMAARLFVPASPLWAETGVAISPGQIRIEDSLSPGGDYRLPSLNVINTGTEPTSYEVVVSYLAGQQEKRPPEQWFRFQPQRFLLEAGQAQMLEVRLTLPPRAEPGEYFAFLEAHPVREGQGVAVNVAVATKLSFTVKPANALQAWLVRINHLISGGQPWTSLLAGALLAYFGVRLVGRYVRIGVRIERRR